MNTHLIFAMLASVTGVICFFPYVRDIFLLKTKPHSYSWLVWALLQASAVFVMLAGGAGVGVASFALSALLCAFIFILSLWFGTKNITAFDTVCLIGAIGALIFWFFLEEALLSVLTIAAVDFIAYLPTVRKSYAEPWTETPSLYLLGTISCIFSVFALEAVNFITSFYLFVILSANLALAALILIRRRGSSAPSV